jgi:hypothetical protein
MKRWIIYRHIHNESGRSYIGLTSQTMERRWKNHIHAAKTSKNGRWHFPNAIRKYCKDAFSHEVLQVCTSLEEANIAEQFWIWTYDTRNLLRGFNLAPGGSHVPHPVKKDHWKDPEFRAKQCAKIKALWQNPVYRVKHAIAWKASINTPESLAKRSISSKEVQARPDILTRNTEAARERMKNITPEHYAKLTRGTFKGHKHTPENLERIRITSTGRKLSDESKEKIRLANLGKKLKPETIAKMRVINTGRKASLEAIAKSRAAHIGTFLSEEAKRKISVKIIESFYRKRIAIVGLLHYD